MSSSSAIEMQRVPPGLLHPLSISASNLFIALRKNPAAVGSLARVEERADVDVCSRVISDILFPPSASQQVSRARPFSICLSSLFATEIAACTDLKRLLRENSLACVVSSSYCKSSVPQAFLTAALKPIFDVALRHPSLQQPSSAYDTNTLISTLRQVIESIRRSCVSSSGDMPDAILFSSRVIADALKAHPLHRPPQTLSVESAVSSVVFLRFIVPFVISFGVGRPQLQMKFFVDLGSALQKLCGGGSFGPGHKLEHLNDAMVPLFAQVQDMLRELAEYTHSDAGACRLDDDDDDDVYAQIAASDLIVFASLLASFLPAHQPCANVEAPLIELTTHRLFPSLNSSVMGGGVDEIRVALNQPSMRRLSSSSGSNGINGGFSSSKRVCDMTNDDLVLRLRTLQTANDTKRLAAVRPDSIASTADPAASGASAAPAAPKLPRAALLSQCLQFFWMGFAWPSMGAVLPRIREMFDLNYAEGTLVFGVFACGLMLGCCFAFDEGRAALVRFFSSVRAKLTKTKNVAMHVEFQDEDETGSAEEIVHSSQQQLRDEGQQQSQHHSFFHRMSRDSDKMKLMVSITLTVVAQLLMGTTVQHAPYSFCLGIWFIMGLANTGLNIFSGIVVSRYGIAAMLASPLAAAIMTKMDNDFSWFYLLQAALGSCVVAAIGLSDFPFEVDRAPAISASSSKISSHLALLIKDRRFAFVMLSSFFYWGLDGVLSQWITTVLLDQGNTISFSSQVLSLLWAGVLVGRGMMALASVSIYKGTPLRNSILMLFCIPPALILAFVITVASPPPAVLLATVFFYGIFLGPMDALLRGLTGALFKHPETGQTNTPFTIMFFACNGSLLLFTPLAGVVIQATSSGRAGLTVGVACGISVLCMAVCLWWKLK